MHVKARGRDAGPHKCDKHRCVYKVVDIIAENLPRYLELMGLSKTKRAISDAGVSSAGAYLNTVAGRCILGTKP